MYDTISSLIGLLPFSWAQYSFMQNALLAILAVVPLFTLLGAMVVNNQMAFFSDTLGHSALTGIALGVIAGLHNPTWSMLIFAVIIAMAVTLIKERTGSSADTIIGAVSATTVALGIVILSKGGGFARYSRYLVGDLLSITPQEVTALALVFLAVLVLWYMIFNKLLVLSINPSLAGSRGIKVKLVETCFAISLALVVTFTIQWIGILIINALLILPAAAARNIATGMRSYHLYAFLISAVCGISGLILSYYWDTATGATIVLLAAISYVITLIIRQPGR